MVKKIIEEHGGWVKIANIDNGVNQQETGAVITIGFVNLA